MIPKAKKKSKELFMNFTQAIWNNGGEVSKPIVKECTLIAVNLILEMGGTVTKECAKKNNIDIIYTDEFWIEVKNQVEKI